MKQDVNATTDAVGGFAPEQKVPVLGIKPGDEVVAVPGATAKDLSDPLYKALNSESTIAPYEELKDWLRSDLTGDSNRTLLVSPEQIRAKRAIEAALYEAEGEVTKFALNRDWKTAKQNLQAARAAGSSVQVIDEAKAKLDAIDAELKKLGMPKYARTTKTLRNYAAAVLSYTEKLPESERDKIARDVVVDLESRMMPKVDNIYMGVAGRMEPLARLALKQPFDAIARLKDLEVHLNGRSQNIDMDQEQRVQLVASNPIFQGIISRAEELPKDGAVFFLKGTKMVRVPNGPTPLMIDVVRMPLGMGKEGSGLFRFIGQEADIDGAAVIKLKLKNGKPIPLKGSDPNNPKFAKEVCELIGNYPEWLRIGMTFGEVMKRFGEIRDQAQSAPAPAPVESAEKEST